MDVFSFLATSFAVITGENWHIYGVLFGAVFTAIVVYDRLDSIRHRNKQSPPLSEIYQTKEAADAMEARMNRSIGSLGGKMDDISKSLQNHTTSFSRTVGELEGTIRMLLTSQEKA